MHEVLTKTWNEFASSYEDINNQSKRSIADSQSTPTLRIYSVGNARGTVATISPKVEKNNIRNVSSFLLL